MRDLIEKIQPDVWLKMCEKISGTSKGNEHFNYHNFLNISTLILIYFQWISLPFNREQKRETCVDYQ